MGRGGVWVGMGEGLVVAVPVAAGLLAVGGWWAAGLLWGLAAVAAGRLARWGLLQVVVREGGGGGAAGVAGVARQALVSVLAVGGVMAGLPPLAVAGGLVLPTVGRWIWTVRLARTLG